MISSEQLPAVLADIARVAGLDAALALAKAKGGQTVFLPRRPGEDHWLSLIVGHKAALAICEEFRGNHTSHLLIPMASHLRRADRVHAAIEAGGSVNQIAGRAGVHERTVRRHRRRRSRSEA